MPNSNLDLSTGDIVGAVEQVKGVIGITGPALKITTGRIEYEHPNAKVVIPLIEIHLVRRIPLIVREKERANLGIWHRIVFAKRERVLKPRRAKDFT
jgi:hypothetical protein